MHAIILAAGQGSRLRPFTNDRPKCMVEVLGKPLLQSTLEALVQAGAQEAVIVTGYLGDRIRRTYGARFDGLRLTYVDNPIFDATGNLYSLWLARAHMDSDFLLLESDLLYPPEVLQELAASPASDVALVDTFEPSMDGTVVLPRGDVAREMVLKKDQGAAFDYAHALKTVNAYKLSGAFARDALAPSLDGWVRAERTGQFYEAVLAELVAGGQLALGLHRMGGRPWAEIDDPADLRRAEALFGAARAVNAGAMEASL